MRSAVLPLLIALIASACGGDPVISADAPGDGPPEPPGPPAAGDLMTRIATCDPVGGTYATDGGGPSDISICGFPNAVAWTADMDIDCDGKMSEQCNLTTDPSYMDQTAATDSNGEFLDAATLPFVVIPGRGTRFDYIDAGLGMRSVVAVIYDGKVEYGVLGDVGPQAIIGEASYRMAELLGIDPDPSTGGVESGVAYIAFTGDDAKVEIIENHDQAVTLGVERAKLLLDAP